MIRGGPVCLMPRVWNRNGWARTTSPAEPVISWKLPIGSLSTSLNRSRWPMPSGCPARTLAVRLCDPSARMVPPPRGSMSVNRPITSRPCFGLSMVWVNQFPSMCQPVTGKSYGRLFPKEKFTGHSPHRARALDLAEDICHSSRVTRNARWGVLVATCAGDRVRGLRAVLAAGQGFPPYMQLPEHGTEANHGRKEPARLLIPDGAVHRGRARAAHRRR